MNKRIIITQRVDYFDNRNETRDSYDQRIVELLNFCGYDAFPMPNNVINNFSNWILSIKPNGFLLTGGNNLGEFPYRDNLEIKILDYSIKNKLPVMGICRGMQIINKWAGGELTKLDNHVGKKHNVYLLKEDMKIIVNSYHQYGIKSCPNNFSVLGISDDSYVEAFKHKSSEIYGVMWHPERETQINDYDLELIKKIFN